VRSRLAVPAAVLCALVTACSGGPQATGPKPVASTPPPSTPSVSASSTPAPPAATATKATVTPTPTATATDCSTYRSPDPKRPVLTADVTVNGAKVVGTEKVVFTPDKDVARLVFRLWASAPSPATFGGASALTAVKVNGKTRAYSRPAPTLVTIPWTGAAGKPITIELGFTITLPTGADDRFGFRGKTSWFASGIPLLAWESGHGWATEPATAQFAEASTSEEMQLAKLTVHHAMGLSALATGATVGSNPTTLVTSALTVRDVAVAVGPFRIASAAGPVPVTVGVAPGLSDDPSVIASKAVTAMRSHVQRFGPFPYQRVVFAVLPDIRGGIEYPGMILLGTKQDKDATLSHELGHEWFYGLVGDDQARDPWLDEALATYAEALDRGTSSRYTADRVPAGARGHTGDPMTFWEKRPSYYYGVYVQGAAALLKARRAAPQAFDAQVRCYVARNAHRIATPGDFAASVPLAAVQLRAVGALKQG
jgi:hypothetical protein